jgi:hypothetical protein
MGEPRRAAGWARVSLAQAFKAQGVALKYAARSRSGIRWDDGAVVIAIEQCDVRGSAEGFSCLLWAPKSASTASEVDRSIIKERLEHCRIALCHGGADGLLVEGGAVHADVVLTLHVARRRDEYWASWASIARQRTAVVHQLPIERGRYTSAIESA